MDKHVAKKWVAALRSGEYQQGTERLKTKKGVLCDISGLGEWEMRWDLQFTYLHVSTYLPEEVRKWAGIRESTAAYETTSLIFMNDKGSTFEQIAEVIEQNWEKI